jgi:aminoglycoside phosphotransferase (APT) family kinase protein
MHGDLQRRNILLTPSGVGVVDWEGAWLHGIPGLDLVFLALLAHRDRPDPTIIDRLLRDRDPPFGALKSPLARLGLPGDTLRPALLAMLGTWALGEDRRLQRTRAAVARRPYRDLLLSFTARLAS